MRPVLTKLTPARGISSFLHYTQVVLLPLILFILIKLNAVQLALAVILLAKWRMLAVRPRFWPANIRANAIDIMVGFAAVVFIAHAGNALGQIIWALLYGAWLLVLKPRSTSFWVSIQAAIGQLAALVALYVAYAGGSLLALSLLTGVICYLAARHFFDSYDEAYARLLSYAWGYIGSATAWLLSHWLLSVGAISQTTILLSAVGYGLALLYYLDHHDRLKPIVRLECIFFMLLVTVGVLISIIVSGLGGKLV